MAPPNPRPRRGSTAGTAPAGSAPYVSTRPASRPLGGGAAGSAADVEVREPSPAARRGVEDRRGDEDRVVAQVASAMARASGAPPAGEVWIGDDAAVLRAPSGPLLLATDAAVAGVHADLSLVGLDDLGWKALTATVSDIGAMGGRPLHAVVSLCLPPGTDVGSLAAGIAEASARWSCPVVGGDVTGADQVVVSVAATGVLEGDGPAVTRSGASPGDRLLVTGPLGCSAAGLRILRATATSGGRGAGDEEGEALVAVHRRPLARIAEGVTARRAGATAMIDVSDGLALDLHRLADASRVGFQLESVPVAGGASEEEALAGGEDYELVIAVPDDRVAALEEAFLAAGLRAPVIVGRCAADPAERLLAGSPLPRSGWQHRLG